MEYNNLQKLACAISGYEPDESWSSAKDDGYYDLPDNLELKVKYVRDVSANLEDLKYVTNEEAIRVIDFLDFEPTKYQGRYQSFLKLQD